MFASWSGRYSDRVAADLVLSGHEWQQKVFKPPWNTSAIHSLARSRELRNIIHSLMPSYASVTSGMGL